MGRLCSQSYEPALFSGVGHAWRAGPVVAGAGAPPAPSPTRLNRSPAGCAQDEGVPLRRLRTNAHAATRPSLVSGAPAREREGDQGCDVRFTEAYNRTRPCPVGGALVG